MLGYEGVVIMENKNWMQTAHRVGLQSPDPQRKVGCLIVDPIKGILASGYNRIPKRLDTPGCYDDVATKRDRVIHAEEDAIVNSHTSLNGTSLYCTRFTCHECAKLVIAVGVDRVFAPDWERSSSWLGSFEKALELYRTAGVEIVPMEETENGLYDYSGDPEQQARLEDCGLEEATVDASQREISSHGVGSRKV